MQRAIPAHLGSVVLLSFATGCGEEPYAPTGHRRVINVEVVAPEAWCDRPSGNVCYCVPIPGHIGVKGVAGEAYETCDTPNYGKKCSSMSTTHFNPDSATQPTVTAATCDGCTATLAGSRLIGLTRSEPGVSRVTMTVSAPGSTGRRFRCACKFR